MSDKILTAAQIEAQRDAYDWPAFELEILDSHEALRAELAKVTKECDGFDSRATRVRVALDQAGIAGVETYPNEDVDHYTKCLRAGGRVVPDDERVRRLTKERDEARAKAHPGWDYDDAFAEGENQGFRLGRAAEREALLQFLDDGSASGKQWAERIQRGEHAKEPAGGFVVEPDPCGGEDL